jgi:hypothetical protein
MLNIRVEPEDDVRKCWLCGVFEYESTCHVSKDTEEHVDVRECIKQLKKQIDSMKVD